MRAAAHTLILTTLLAACGPETDVSQPIVLVAEPSWTALEQSILDEAGQCWNLRFGTRVRAGQADEALQIVPVSYSDFICMGFTGIAKRSIPRLIHICPPGYRYRMTSDRTQALFEVLVHEIGHILNLGHAQDPYSVMYPGSGDSHPFTDEDVALFEAENPDFDLAPVCRDLEVRIAFDPGTVPACRCAKQF